METLNGCCDRLQEIDDELEEATSFNDPARRENATPNNKTTTVSTALSDVLSPLQCNRCCCSEPIDHLHRSNRGDWEDSLLGRRGVVLWQFRIAVLKPQRHDLRVLLY